LMTVAGRNPRARFKTIVFWVLGAQDTFLLIMLLNGLKFDFPSAPPETEGGGECLASSPGPEPQMTAPPATATVPSLAPAALVVRARTPTEVAPPAVRQPAKEETAAPVVKPAAEPPVYVVKSGDTLGRIARSYGTTVKAIQAANNLNDTHLSV